MNTKEKQIKELTEQKDNAYHERDMLVAALSKVYASYLGRHEESDTTWEEEWRNIVYIYIQVEHYISIPGRGKVKMMKPMQVSWHIHDSELPLFEHLKYNPDIKWDGHTTEEKYERLRNITR